MHIKGMTIGVVIGLLLVLSHNRASCAQDSSPLKGNGTRDNPYLIESSSDLLILAESVNAGNSYLDQYIVQTADINLLDIDWPTIGLWGTEYSFEGIYDGNGHVIQNLHASIGGNNSLFGQLGGTVMNLGIDSGEISGACVGGITSHSSREEAQIINCYNKATVQGARAGGIADNFNGLIANCWSDCELVAEERENIGGIVSYGASSCLNSISIEEPGRSGVELNGCDIVDRRSVDYSELAEQLNATIFDTALVTGIDYRDLYFWSASEDNKSIAFAGETAHFQAEYMLPYIRAYLIKTIPYILTISILALIIFILIKGVRSYEK